MHVPKHRILQFSRNNYFDHWQLKLSYNTFIQNRRIVDISFVLRVIQQTVPFHT